MLIFRLYTITSNKIAMHNSNENDQELQNDEKITALCHGSNIALIKY